MRHLALEPFPGLVEAPAERRYPGEAGFDHHHLELGHGVEQALEDHAGDQGGARRAVFRHLLDIVGGPAGIGDGPAAVAEDVNADGQAVSDGFLVDRPVAFAPQGLGGAAEQQDLAKILVAGPLADFRDGGIRILVGDDDRGLEPGIAPRPVVELPVIGGRCQGGRQMRIHFALSAGAEGIENAVIDAIGVEMLLPHELQAGTGRRAVGRKGIAPHAVGRLRFGVGVSTHVTMPPAHAVGAEMLPPLRRHVGPQILDGAGPWMEIAIDDAHACGGIGGGGAPDVHDRLSLRRG